MPTTTAPRCFRCNRRTKNVQRCGASLYCPKCRVAWLEMLRRRSREAAAERKAAGIRDHEPTTEELDALIARQMKRLPAWWRRELSTDESQKPFLKGR